MQTRPLPSVAGGVTCTLSVASAPEIVTGWSFTAPAAMLGKSITAVTRWRPLVVVPTPASSRFVVRLTYCGSLMLVRTAAATTLMPMPLVGRFSSRGLMICVSYAGPDTWMPMEVNISMLGEMK